MSFGLQYCPLSRGIGVQNCPPTGWSVALPAFERSRWLETIARIRREHFIKGETIKEIARDLKVSRNTARKVLRSGETSFEYERLVQPRPKLGRWATELDGLLAGNAAKPAREQLTLIRIFEERRGRGYDGGYDAVRRYARRWSKERGQSTAAAYVPLSFAPGEAYQFDWSHEVVLLNGVTVIVKAAHVRLCHSHMLFVRCYPRETQRWCAACSASRHRRKEFERWSLSFSTTAKTPAGVSRTVVPVDMGQTRNSSMRAYVFRLTLNSRHCQAAPDNCSRSIRPTVCHDKFA